jgi:hypothetical protein
MAALTLGSVAATVEAYARGTLYSVEVVLWLVVAGAAVTALRRTWRIARNLASSA